MGAPCRACGRDNGPGRRFCATCGAPLARPCAACGFTNEPDDAFCGGCGAALDAGTTAERRQVTVLFADLKGYTPLSERLGEEGAWRLMDRVYKVMIGVVDRFGGTVQELTGDGILALFGAPRALEDAPLRACAAALAIQEEMRAVSERLQAEQGVDARARIGVSTGPVVVASVGTETRVELKAIGDTVNVAARLEAMAPPGGVLVSDATHALVAGAVEAVDLGLHQVKGKSAPLRVHRLARLREGADRFARSRRLGLTPLVGRSAELQALHGFWQDACAGRWRVVHVAGEPGIGKTRAVHELSERVAGSGGLVLAGHCAATGTTTAFLPFVEVVRQAFRVGAEDGAAAVAGTIGRGLAVLGIEEPRALPYLLNLLGVEHEALRGLDGEIIGVHTREALGAVITARSRLSPLLLVLDDVHWIDRASEQLVEQLLGSGGLARLLVVCTQRPQYRAPWARRAEYAEIRLDALPREALAEVLRRCVGEARVADDVVRGVVDAAGGNPLFAEELGRYLAEQGAPTGSGLPVPSSLQGLVMARVDQLDDLHRRALQVAAVVGRRFRLGLVARVAGLDGRAASIVRALEDAELVTRDDGDDGYAFRHVLVQEAIYQSLLTDRRRELHRRVGQAIERQYAGRLAEWVDELAHHFDQADDPARAVTYLRRAGERSLRVYALEEADDRFRRAMARAEQPGGDAGDAEVAGIVLRWAHVHYYRRDFRGQAELVERYLPRIDALGASRLRALLLFWLGFAYAMRWRLEPARRHGEQALALAEAIGDEECIGYACMGLLYAGLGESGAAGRRRVEALAARAVDIAARRNDVYLGSKALWGRAFDRLLAGCLGPALADTRAVLEMGRAAGDPRTIAMGLWGTATISNLDGRHEEALDLAEEALRVSPDPLDRMTALAAKGGALTMLGRPDEGLAILDEVRRDIVERDFLSVLPGVDGYRGLALVMCGRLAEGTAWLESSVRRFLDWGTPRSANLQRMLLGEIYLEASRGGRRASLGFLARNAGWLLTRGPFARRRARACFEAAARAARETASEGVLAWALVDLAVLDARPRPEEARRRLDEAERLAPVAAGALLERKLAEARALLGAP